MALAENQIPQRLQIALYFGTLMLTLGLADPLGIVNLPILFLLKDTLGRRPPTVAAFETIILTPVYFGLFFGFLRDRWRPFGLGDRGYLLLSAPVAVCAYIWLAIRPISFTSLLAAVLLIMVAFQFMDTAAQAMIAAVGQRYRMTGRLSAVAELLEVSPKIIAMLLGGWMVGHANPRTTFLAAAMITALIACQSLWRPDSNFAEHGKVRVVVEDSRAAVRRLLRHRPLWPTAAILLMWNFAPGWGTSFLYYLSDEVGISSEVFAICKAVHLACIAATALLYGIYCHRKTLRTMLWWGVGLNIFPGVLFLLIHSAPAAIGVSALVGLACGVGNVAVFDLLLRSCPKHLEGSAMMLGFAALTAAEAAGDLLGSFLYDQSGFLLCLVIDALGTLCILPLLRWVPSGVLDSRDQDWKELPSTVNSEAGIV